MRKYLSILVLLFAFSISKAQKITGTWKGNIEINGTKLPVVFHLNYGGNGELQGTWDSPAQSALGLTFSSLRATNDSLFAEVESLNSNYSGKIIGEDSIAGTWTQGGMGLPLNFGRVSEKDISKDKKVYPGEKEIKITSAGTPLFGTLSSKNNLQKLVIIIAGSGPTDRDGNNPLGSNTDGLKMVARSLDSQNIASFRFDKRGVGKSILPGMKENELVFENYIKDAENIFSYLHDTLGYRDIYFLGHSEGSLIGMIAASHTKAKGFISVAGAGRPAEVIINEQIQKSNLSDSLKAEVRSIFDKLKNGKLQNSYSPQLEFLFRKSVQPYLISWLQFSPEAEIKKVKCPILLLQGDCDIQVSIADAQNLRNANKKSQLVIIPQMTHTLKNAGAACKDQKQTYSDNSLPVDKKLMGEIIGFVKKN